MKKIAVVYWSGTGNTEQMAQAIEQSIKNNGAEAYLFQASEFDPSSVKSYDALAFGCPSMGAEVLEDSEFEPMFDSCKNSLAGKKIGLFGSYGWGDGEWMRNWHDDCENLGAILVSDPVICNESPDQQAIDECTALGKALVNS